MNGNPVNIDAYDLLTGRRIFYPFWLIFEEAYCQDETEPTSAKHVYFRDFSKDIFLEVLET